MTAARVAEEIKMNRHVEAVRKHMTSELRRVIIGALYVAKQQYERDAVTCGGGGDPSSMDQFEKQARECGWVIDSLE